MCAIELLDRISLKKKLFVEIFVVISIWNLSSWRQDAFLHMEWIHFIVWCSMCLCLKQCHSFEMVICVCLKRKKRLQTAALSLTQCRKERECKRKKEREKEWEKSVAFNVMKPHERSRTNNADTDCRMYSHKWLWILFHFNPYNKQTKNMFLTVSCIWSSSTTRVTYTHTLIQTRNDELTSLSLFFFLSIFYAIAVSKAELVSTVCMFKFILLSKSIDILCTQIYTAFTWSPIGANQKPCFKWSNLLEWINTRRAIT